MNNRHTNLVRKVLQYITEYKLVKKGDHVIAAVSGGPDSIAMLYILHQISPQLKLKITVAHLHHGIRGVHADRDLLYVKNIASKLGVDFVSRRVNVPAIARKKHLSLEMAGRNVRYCFLSETAQKIKATVIATAHTLDDQAETILLKLARGAGRSGLSGIARVTEYNGVRVIRPLLNITRKEIEQFLHEHKISYREDASNRNVEILRNCVRHEILPLLRQKLNPQIETILARTAEIFQEEEEYLNTIARKSLNKIFSSENPGIKIDTKYLRRVPLAIRRRILILWLERCGYPVEKIEFDMVNRIAHMIEKSSRPVQLHLAGQWTVTCRYGNLELLQPDASLQPLKRKITVKIPGETIIRKLGIYIVSSLRKKGYKNASRSGNNFQSCALLDANKLKKNGEKLYVRTWRNGDRMHPSGMKGSRKLQDIFVDMKIPVERRRLLPLFLCGREIIWVPGYRIAEGWEGTFSKKTLLIEIKPLDKHNNTKNK